MRLIKTLVAAQLVLGAAIATTVAVGLVSYSHHDHHPPDTLQDQLKQAGYIVVHGSGPECRPEVKPKVKVVVTCS